MKNPMMKPMMNLIRTTLSCDVPNASTELENDANEAICNLPTYTDIHIPVGPSELAHRFKHVKRLLKDLQPHREKPSKDRSRRFQASALYGDQL